MSIAILLTVAATFAPINSLPTSSGVIETLRISTYQNQSLNTGPVELTNQYNLIAEYCGIRTLNLIERVDQVKWLAASALVDARLYGKQSDFGFTAMFKNDEAQGAVVAVLDYIYSSRGKANLRPRPDLLSTPRVACVTENSAKLYEYLQLGYDPWQRCLVGGPRSTPMHAFYASDTIYTFLCPAFFVQPQVSTQDNCPSVTDNTFSGDSGIVYRNYQTYILLYQLIRFYLGDNALTDHSDPREQLDWNDCVRLDTLHSVLNPTNLQIYAALVSQRCTEWPNPFAPPFRVLDSLSSNLTFTGSRLSSTPSTTPLQPVTK